MGPQQCLLPFTGFYSAQLHSPYLSSLITSTKWASVFSRMFLNLRGSRADWSRLTPPQRPFSCSISYSEVWLLLSFSSWGGLRSPFWVFGLCPPGAWKQRAKHTQRMSAVKNRQKRLQGAKTERSSSLSTLSSALTTKTKLPSLEIQPHFLWMYLPHLPCACLGAAFVLFMNQLSKEQKNKAHFHTLNDNQPPAQISFIHLTVKILPERKAFKIRI